MTTVSNISAAIRRFLDWCPHRQFDFPLGGSVPMLQSAEWALLAEAERIGAQTATDGIVQIRDGISFRHAYSLVIFAVRSALVAARTERPNLLRCGLVGLMIDDGEADWRDVLTALVLIEDCANRLGVDFASEIRRASNAMAADRRMELIEEYLLRSPEMREIDVMGYATKGRGPTLDFVRVSS